ncbi:TlpA family protein disulfide reductase [Bradyrhizobium icense]|nr:TlpA disulfide reductase family protein [Bradyrhizobium icense]
MHPAPKAVPAVTFEVETGASQSLAEFTGKVVVLNIWATWCVPCRLEMPALDRLQSILGSDGFAVVPVSIDRGGIEAVKKFYGEIAIKNLPIYLDVSGQAVRRLDAVGLPTTLILDRNGQEIVRVIGPAEWDAPEITEFLKSIIARKVDSIEQVAHNDDRHESTPGLLARGLRWLKALVAK